MSEGGRFIDDEVIRTAADDAVLPEIDYLASEPNDAVWRSVERLNEEVGSGLYERAYRLVHEHRHAVDGERPPAFDAVYRKLVTRIGGFEDGSLDDWARSLFLASGAEAAHSERLVFAQPHEFKAAAPEHIHLRRDRSATVALCGVTLPDPQPATRGIISEQNRLLCAACLAAAEDDSEAFPELHEPNPFKPLSRQEDEQLIEKVVDRLAPLAAASYSSVDEFKEVLAEEAFHFLAIELSLLAATRLLALPAELRFERLFDTTSKLGRRFLYTLGVEVKRCYGDQPSWPEMDQLAAIVVKESERSQPDETLLRAALVAEQWPLAVTATVAALGSGELTPDEQSEKALSLWQSSYPTLSAS